MLGKLLLLFIVVPTIELILLIQIGQLIGTLPTIALIIFTGVLGAFLTRRQGLRVLTKIRAELQTGQMPADSIFDGAVILIAGAFLMTPGILTDTVGFLCLIPTTRRVIKRIIWARIQRAMGKGQIFTTASSGSNHQDRVYPNNVYRDDPHRDNGEDVIIIDHDDYS